MNTTASFNFHKHRAWAEALARSYAHAKKLRHTDLEVAKNSALFGLMQAAESFDPDQGVPFKAFARARVLGEILDHSRQQDLVPRRDYLKKTGREVPVMEPFDLAQHIIKQLNPELENVDVRDLIELVIKSLDQRQLTIITLHFFENLSLSEIGDKLGLSSSYVSSLKKQALATLKEKILEAQSGT